MSASHIIWILISISFVTYFIVSLFYKKLGIHNLQSALQVHAGLRLLNLKHGIGIVLFGIIFYIIVPEYRFLVRVVEVPGFTVLSLFLLTLFLSAYLSRVSIKNQISKIGKVGLYHVSDAWPYFAIRFAFLFCYEFFFRGVLLYKFLEFSSLSMAVFYSTVLYVLIHIFDSRKEILGAIPFGVVLCLFAYYTRSIWYVFLIHLSLSAVYEFSMFYYLTLKNKAT
ncbi:CPBP family intramembrane glutamic endopeptidase [Aestuariivivens sediminicola]|uniref:CPBP family intramembrane glutamic endopeptidase n=1 Tax=Aestuariivivens sediminicola TaxID=2913560 RepID=UPI001F58413E|nr:CPBP family intramembrane glutamic endopeptidase [Aestuariivivens sediminicola]